MTLREARLAVDVDGNLRRPICSAFAELRGESQAGNDLGRYWAAVRCDKLPQSRVADGVVVARGGAVGWSGPWAFFPSIEPAAAFGRSARMSNICSGYGVFEATSVTAYCPRHSIDEHILLLGRQIEDKDEEALLVQRFAQSANTNTHSAGWLG